eukprot:EG_transcript_263
MGTPDDIGSVQRALLAYNEDEDLRDLCEANGLTKEEFASGRFSVHFLEYFLSPPLGLQVLEWFPMLQELQLMHCNLERISGLDRCPNLERLWLNENSLTVIEGLSRCVKLKELYLYTNELIRIEGLDTLAELEVLWLMENRIARVEGLDGCRKLRRLSLASNCIETVAGTLDALTQLEELNVAGNRIAAFHDIPYLDRFPNLRSLSFADPHFGVNPVCQLCNYQTYAIHHLRRLTKLDCLTINEEQRQLAEGTFTKKRMYYNMRIKTLKRNTTNLLKTGLQFRQSKRAEVGAALPVLNRSAKLLQHHLFELENGLSTPSGPSVPELREQLGAVTATLRQRREELEALDQLHREMRDVVQNLSIHHISRFVLELQTGGNIRLEEGKPGEMWYKSCMDLVRSRFYTADFLALGLKDIKVVKVTRIHNRFLRNRFEDHLATIMDPGDAVAKRALEYLFCGEDSAQPGELLRAVQHGFPASAVYEALGKDGGVPLSNSVFLCEEARLRQQQQQPGRRLPDVGRFIISKVYIGNAVSERDTLATPRDASKANRPPIRRAEYADSVNAVYRCKEGDPKQRVWFVFDHVLVLPEYLVECVYEPVRPTGGPLLGNDVEELHSVIGKLTAVRAEVDLADMKIFAFPFVAYMQASNVIASASQEASSAFQKPVLKEPPVLTELTPPALQFVARSHDLSRVTYLNLLGSPLRSLAGLAALRSLRCLGLAFCGLERLAGLANLPCLERVDVAFNAVKHLEGLEGLPSLTTLELNNNLLNRLDDLQTLSRCVPRLRTLQLSGNGLCDTKNYRAVVLQHLPALEVLDGQDVTLADQEVVCKAAGSITEETLLAAAALQLTSHWSATLAPLASHEGAAAGACLSVADALDDGLGEDVSRTASPLPEAAPGAAGVALATIVSLNLSRMGLRRMEHLGALRSLRRLTMADNEIPRIEGLEALCKLEELNLEDNCIQRIEGLQNLPHLRKLELGKNRIGAVEGLQGNLCLCQISLEDNEIASLKGFETLSSLMELYLNNNQVESVKEANHLRDLEKLIILDLSGNPMCKDPEYRLYSVYHLRRLKVLDGIGIAAAETTLAKETFTGKMTPELLAERAGSSLDWGSVTELTLSHCGLKDVALLGQFRALAILKLDHNLLSELRGIEGCVALRQLDLSFNRFRDSLDAREPPQRNPIGRALLGLVALDALFLDGNGIQTISSLQLQLPALRCLSLRQNDLAKFGGLDQLPQLQLLVLDKNKIRTFDPAALAPISRLLELRVEENHIRSLEGLGTLQALKRLSLVSNRIADPLEIDRVDPMEELEEVWLAGNTVARKPHYRYGVIHKFPKLTHIDGKEVTAEERERAGAFFSQASDSPYVQGPVGALPLNLLVGGAPPPQNGPKVAAAAGPPVKVSVLSLLDGAGPIAVQGVNGKATAPAPRQRSAVGRAGAGGGALPNGGPDSVARRRVTAAAAAAAGRGPIPPTSGSRGGRISPRSSNGVGGPPAKPGAMGRP